MSANDILYEFKVEEPHAYTQTWRGEIPDYLESDRSLPAAPGSREAIVITKKPAAKPKQAKAAKAVKHRRSRNQSSGIAAE